MNPTQEPALVGSRERPAGLSREAAEDTAAHQKAVPWGNQSPMSARRRKGVWCKGCHVFVIPASWPELFEYISPTKGQAPKGT